MDRRLAGQAVRRGPAMITRLAVLALLATPVAMANDAEGGTKRISGMSILGNQEAPKALVIIPWKSSEPGDALAVESMLDDSRRPVDRDVFMRELGYYQISQE